MLTKGPSNGGELIVETKKKPFWFPANCYVLLHENSVQVRWKRYGMGEERKGGMRRPGQAPTTARATAKEDKIVAQSAKAEQADQAVRERICLHSLAIVNLAHQKIDPEIAHAHGFEILQTEQFGTGAAVLWNGLELIVTAKHVIDGASNIQLALMPRVMSKIVWHTEEATREFKQRFQPRIKEIIRCRWEDLALIRLEDGESGSMNLQFADLEGSVTPAAGSMGVYVGHPFDKSLEVRRIRLEDNKTEIQKSLSPMMTAGKISFLTDQEAQYYKNFDPKRYFTIDFSHAAATGVDGKGFSGAGVWYHRVPRTPLWEPKLGSPAYALSNMQTRSS